MGAHSGGDLCRPGIQELIQIDGRATFHAVRNEVDTSSTAGREGCRTMSHNRSYVQFEHYGSDASWLDLNVGGNGPLGHRVGQTRPPVAL